jgi:tRNA nucleotidyltransferase/poly(A) polymerase
MSFRVVTGSTILDVTGINGPTIRHDLERRDVTINAMAVELSSSELLDWVGGQRDLAGKRIRMVSETAFKEDPIRLLRAFRLAAALGFSIEDQTVSVIARDAPLIRLSAGERIRSELFQLFSCRDSSPHVELMEKTGLLRAIFQELPVDPETDTGAVHPFDSQQLFLPAYRQLETLLNHPPSGYPPQGANNESPLPRNTAAWLKLAWLMTRRDMTPDGKAEGDNNLVHAAESICHRLRLSTKETTFVLGIVGNFNQPFHLRNAFSEGRLTPKTATRFFMNVGPLAPHLMLCALAESRHDPADSDSFLSFFRHILRAYAETYLPGKTRPPLVSGRDLASVFGLRPSPLFKKVLTRLEEARLSGEVTDKTSALQMAERLIRDRI